VHEAREGGLLRSEPARVVAELLDFGDLTAGQVMVPRVRVVAIPLGASAEDLRRVLLERPFTRYPVSDGTVDRIVGMLHVKDILRCLPSCAALQADQVRAVPYVPESATMDQLMAAMRQANAQLAVVLDEHGGTAGIVTAEDLFEEVVGDIGDEGTGAPEVLAAEDGTVVVAGVARLETLGDALGIELAHPDVDTVSGLVLTLLGRSPQVGDAVTYAGRRIEVTTVRGRGVGAAVVGRVSSLGPEPTSRT
jgi:CBS domain containing-hemolysin-like protein